MYGLMLACFLLSGIIPRLLLLTPDLNPKFYTYKIFKNFTTASNNVHGLEETYFPPLLASDINRHIDSHHLQPHLIVEREVGANVSL